MRAAGVYALVAAGCASAPAQGGRPSAPPLSEPTPASVVAIAEPGESVEVDEEPLPAATRSSSLAGEWIEDWPDRGGCDDRIQIRELRGELELSGSDCNDGEAYRYFDIISDARALRFKLQVKSTDRVLDYDLRLGADGELTGPVTGGAEATVTWRRAEP